MTSLVHAQAPEHAERLCVQPVAPFIASPQACASESISLFLITTLVGATFLLTALVRAIFLLTALVRAVFLFFFVTTLSALLVTAPVALLVFAFLAFLVAT